MRIPSTVLSKYETFAAEYCPKPMKETSMYLSQNSVESSSRKLSFIFLIKVDLNNLKLLSGFEICAQAAGYNGAHTVG